MKAADLAQLCYRIRADLVVTSLGVGCVNVQPLTPERHRQHLADLAQAVAALADPASLLTEEELFDAALASTGCVDALLHELTDDALLGELARRGRWLLDTTPAPFDPEPPEAA